jgi:hypothetical protein
MKTNDLIYHVDPINETVECRVLHCKTDFLSIADKLLKQYPEHIRYFYKFINVYYCEQMIRDEYIGKSICSQDDKFDEQYGRDIARTKAIIKRENAFNNALEAILDAIHTLVDVNVRIDRDSVLDRHIDNMCDLLENAKSLSEIRGYSKNEDKDKCEIINNIDLNKDYTPHHCALCGKTFLNYKDDKDYLNNEHNWWLIDMPFGKKTEMCSSCVNTIEKLSD